MDADSILYALFNIQGIAHGSEHTFFGAALIAFLTIIARATFQRVPMAWIYGAVLGAFSHVLLDMLVHPEMEPLFPIAGNPFYQGWMEPVSILLLPLTVWFIFQIVSYSLDYVRRRQEPVQAHSEEPSSSKTQ